MIERNVSLPTIALIAGTRFILGVGVGLLISGRLDPEKRHDIGWTLFTVGALVTIPLVAQVLGGHSVSHDGRSRDRRPAAVA